MSPFRLPVHLRRSAALVGAALLLFLTPAIAVAQENEDCMRCHGDDELVVEKGDLELSGFIDLKAYEASTHGRLDCITCHLDLEDMEGTHEDDLEPVSCAECHDEPGEALAGGAHGKAAASGHPSAPNCASCHGKHAILPATNPASRTHALGTAALCGQCHGSGGVVEFDADLSTEQAAARLEDLLHGHGLSSAARASSPNCVSCHGAHEITGALDQASTISRERVAATCLQCHAGLEDAHAARIDPSVWKDPAKLPACTSCHVPHEASPDRAARGVTGHGGLACAQCHTAVNASHERPCDTKPAAVACATCHAAEAEEQAASGHAAARRAGNRNAPDCRYCHEPHEARGADDPLSSVAPRNIPSLCGRCHDAAGGTLEEGAPPTPPGDFAATIHGKGLNESGLIVTATCVSCHGAHRVLPADHPDSTIYNGNTDITCGKCHQGIQETLAQSVHWPANVETDRKLPSCADCHSSHSISRTDRAGFRAEMMDQCGGCHEEQAHSFFDTFHGKVSRLGFDNAARCSDCHGSHDILPSRTPGSRLHGDRKIETCAQCHPDSHAGFVGYLTHATHDDPENQPALYYAFWGMTTLLLGTLVFFGAHSLLWMFRLWRTRSEWGPVKARRNEGPLYRRFDRLQRGMHLTMVVSFMTLALTGMTLKFSSAPWAHGMADFIGGFGIMSTLHRLAALTLILVALTHVWDVNRRRKLEGKSWWWVITGPRTILFNFGDVKEFLATMKWFFGRGPRPRYGRWAYWEKFDYFAVFWGIGVIGSTGMMLWFPEVITYVLPGWTLNVSTIVHGDEALLAASFIFTIHFFNTQFRPDKFPLDPVIFTGRQSLEELMHEKPREYEELLASGKLDDHLVEPLPAHADRFARVFAASALCFGLMLVCLIFYALALSFGLGG